MQTTIEGVSFTHKFLWQIAQEQAAISRRRRRGWVNFSLVASVFASNVVEAYVNYMGERLDKARWADERNARFEVRRTMEGKGGSAESWS